MPSPSICDRFCYKMKMQQCQHGAYLGPVDPRWAPCWSREPCYQGYFTTFFMMTSLAFEYDCPVPMQWPSNVCVNRPVPIDGKTRKMCIVRGLLCNCGSINEALWLIRIQSWVIIEIYRWRAHRECLVCMTTLNPDSCLLLNLYIIYLLFNNGKTSSFLVVSGVTLLIFYRHNQSNIMFSDRAPIPIFVYFSHSQSFTWLVAKIELWLPP